MSLDAYLMFPGNCEEAIGFYARALGAEVEMMMRLADSPEPLPDACANMPADAILHASLKLGERRLMACDTPPDAGPAFKGFSIYHAPADEAAARRLFDALSEGGSVQMPLGKTFWSPCFGMLTDRYGVAWMLGVDEPA